MRTTALAAVALLALGFVACGKSAPPPEAPRPVAPATPPPAPPPSAPRDVVPQENEYERLKGMSSDEINRMGLLPDIHFDFDRADIREEDRQILARNAESLKKFDFLRVTVEGHCDERGTVEYNLALGERRSKAAFDYLMQLGVPAARLKSVSYGKEVPLCRESSEDCWARNRRATFTVTGKTSGR
ncbi:MAG TPA: peptidoglycan-associated lipoprotein Pal [Vicinamibacteria bacterium]|nr:peptidoglycan-associated lipoprotein Pal [Vicinamibacteria bacterium]